MGCGLTLAWFGVLNSSSRAKPSRHDLSEQATPTIGCGLE
jgi:hypothetical protein